MAKDKLIHETIPGQSQYFLEPDSPEEEAAKKKAYQEWCDSRTADNIPEEYMDWNHNGCDPSKPTTIESIEEHYFVWKFACDEIRRHPERRAVDTFMAVCAAYRRHIESGAPPSGDFDPTLLAPEYK